MTWTGGDVLWAGATAVATPAAVLLCGLAAMSGVGAVGGMSRRAALAPGLGLAVVYSVTLLLRDPLLARPWGWTHAGVGGAFLALGLWRWRRAGGFLAPGLVAPLLGLLLALLRPPLAGPRLLLLYGVEGGSTLSRWLYHLGTGLALAVAFLLVHALATGWGERRGRRWGAWGWIVAGVGVGFGGFAWLGRWLVLRWPPGSLG